MSHSWISLNPGELLEAPGRISPMRRASVLLHHGYGYPVWDVVRILDSTTPAVKVLQHVPPRTAIH